jgi:predicted DNA-binding protein (MmcQ/YjbR family)
MADPKRTHQRVLEFGLRLPGAWEDHPWEETVIKVGKKIFVFLGSEASPMHPSIHVKLRESHAEALGVPGAEPTGYGLGKAGWVTIPLGTPKAPSLGVLTDWVEESYRLIAPKKLVAELDSGG